MILYKLSAVLWIVVEIFLSRHSASQSTGNLYILKDEIEEAMKGCSEYTDRQNAQMEFERKASSVSTKTKRETNSDLAKLDEWDYGDFYKDDDSQNNYNTNRSTLNGNALNNSNHQPINTNRSRFSSDEGGDFRSVRDLNFTADQYDPYTTRGMQPKRRQKRFKEMMKTFIDSECLSSCVFANLQIIDDRGIPKESMFLKYVQDNVSSQQSKSILEKQIETCFKDLASESEDNACFYSNALERCMDLQFKNRHMKTDNGTT